MGRSFRFIYRYIFILFLPLFVLSSCRTANSLSVVGAEEEGLYDILAESEPHDSYYLFIRLYDPVYKNPFYMSTLLKGGIALTEVHPLKLSHASIGLDLTDNFFGLTLMPRPMLNEEHATDVSTNDFMVQCKMDKSSQTTFVLPVTAEEYERVKSVLYQYRNANYSSGKVIQAALKAISRKMRAKRNRTLEVALATKKGTPTVVRQMDKKRKFSCSAFVAFVLYNSVDEITQYFDEHNTNLNYVSVTDLAYLPGVRPLFSSSWQDYNLAAQTYVDEHQEFMSFASRDK